MLVGAAIFPQPPRFPPRKKPGALARGTRLTLSNGEVKNEGTADQLANPRFPKTLSSSFLSQFSVHLNLEVILDVLAYLGANFRVGALGEKQDVNFLLAVHARAKENAFHLDAA